MSAYCVRALSKVAHSCHFVYCAPLTDANTNSRNSPQTSQQGPGKIGI